MTTPCAICDYALKNPFYGVLPVKKTGEQLEVKEMQIKKVEGEKLELICSTEKIVPIKKSDLERAINIQMEDFLLRIKGYLIDSLAKTMELKQEVVDPLYNTNSLFDLQRMMSVYPVRRISMELLFEVYKKVWAEENPNLYPAVGICKKCFGKVRKELKRLERMTDGDLVLIDKRIYPSAFYTTDHKPCTNNYDRRVEFMGYMTVDRFSAIAQDEHSGMFAEEAKANAKEFVDKTLRINR